MIFFPKVLSIILFLERGVADSSCVMIENRIAIYYCYIDGVFIQSKFINVEEDGCKVL